VPQHVELDGAILVPKVEVGNIRVEECPIAGIRQWPAEPGSLWLSLERHGAEDMDHGLLVRLAVRERDGNQLVTERTRHGALLHL
jgi:hypothetical protein